MLRTQPSLALPQRFCIQRFGAPRISLHKSAAAFCAVAIVARSPLNVSPLVTASLRARVLPARSRVD